MNENRLCRNFLHGLFFYVLAMDGLLGWLGYLVCYCEKTRSKIRKLGLNDPSKQAFIKKKCQFYSQ
jgi:hypothetical protein